MEWTVHGERSVYGSEWMGVSLVDVELPSRENRRRPVAHGFALVRCLPGAVITLLRCA